MSILLVALLHEVERLEAWMAEENSKPKPDQERLSNWGGRRAAFLEVHEAITTGEYRDIARARDMFV